MALFYLVRHGEANYEAAEAQGFFGFGRDLAPLSELGVQQAEAAAQDPRLMDAEFILSSSFARALQTAAIISRVTGKRIIVEPGLHEWLPDKTNTFRTDQEAFDLTDEFNAHRGIAPTDREVRWESLPDMRARMREVLDRYAHHDRVIVVAHGMAFRSICSIESMKNCEIVECPYEKGQEDAVYFFH